MKPSILAFFFMISLASQAAEVQLREVSKPYEGIDWTTEVVLESKEVSKEQGQRAFILPRQAAKNPKISLLLADLLSDEADNTEAVIPLPCVDGETLSLLVRYLMCLYHTQDFSPLSKPLSEIQAFRAAIAPWQLTFLRNCLASSPDSFPILLGRVLLAANYIRCSSLRDLIAATIASQLKDTDTPKATPQLLNAHFPVQADCPQKQAQEAQFFRGPLDILQAIGEFASTPTLERLYNSALLKEDEKELLHQLLMGRLDYRPGENFYWHATFPKAYDTTQEGYWLEQETEELIKKAEALLAEDKTPEEKLKGLNNLWATFLKGRTLVDPTQHSSSLSKLASMYVELYRWEQVKEQVWNHGKYQVENQGIGEVKNQVGSSVHNQVLFLVMDYVGDEVREEVRDNVGIRISRQVGERINRQVENELEEQIWDRVRNQVEPCLKSIFAELKKPWKIEIKNSEHQLKLAVIFTFLVGNYKTLSYLQTRYDRDNQDRIKAIFHLHKLDEELATKILDEAKKTLLTHYDHLAHDGEFTDETFLLREEIKILLARMGVDPEITELSP